MSYRLNTKQGKAWRDTYLRGVTIRKKDTRNGVELLAKVAGKLQRQVDELEQYRAKLQLRYDLVVGLCVASRLALEYLEVVEEDKLQQCANNAVRASLSFHDSAASVATFSHLQSFNQPVHLHQPCRNWFAGTFRSYPCKSAAGIFVSIYPLLTPLRVCMQRASGIKETRAAGCALEAQISAVLSREPITQLLAEINSRWLKTYAPGDQGSQLHGHQRDPVTILTSFLGPDCSGERCARTSYKRADTVRSGVRAEDGVPLHVGTVYQYFSSSKR